jgi:hypothetical protein
VTSEYPNNIKFRVKRNSLKFDLLKFASLLEGMEADQINRNEILNKARDAVVNTHRAVGESPNNSGMLKVEDK